MLTNAYEIPFTLAAGASLVLPAGSFEFVYLSSVSAGASVRLKGSQVSIDLVVGRRVEFGNPTVQPLTLENNGSGSVSGVLLVGSGNVRDSTVVGSVSVIDGGLEVVGSKVAFCVRAFKAAVVGEYSAVQLFNPAGSGKRVILDQYSLGSDVAGAISVAGGVAEQSAGTIRSPENCYIGDVSASVCNVWSVSDVEFWTAKPGYFLIAGVTVVADSTFAVVPPRPFILDENMGLLFFPTAVNAKVESTLFWYEESI